MTWQAAVGGVAAVGSTLLGGKKSSSSTKDPKYLQGAKQQLVTRATDLSNRPQETYGGDRIAGLSANEQSAINLAGRGSEESRSAFTKAGEQLDASTSEFNKDNLDQYMNPFIEDVLQPQLREQNKQYERSRTALQNSDRGAWGGDRSAIAASELERNQMEGISDLTGKTYAQAFDVATKNFFNDKSRQQSAAQSYQRLGEGISALDTNDIQNLMATGGVQRLLKQAGLDTEYAKFIETRDWDVNNLDILMQAIGSAGGNTTTTRTDKSGAAGQILGAGAALAGMYFGGKKSFTDRGGEVKQSVSQGTAAADWASSPGTSYFNPASGGSPSMMNA